MSHGTQAKYEKQVEQFLSFADEEKLALVADDEVDAAIVQILNMSCSQGRPVSDGEVLLAGLLFFQPQHGKLGGQKTRSVVESSGGWRKKAPTRSRRLLPRVFCSGVCWEMVRNKKPLMAIHVLMMVVTYFRPGELLQSMREDLIRPMHGVASDWSLLLHPVQRGVPSKTQSYDDTICKTKSIPGSQKWLQSWRAAVPPRRSSSTGKKISPRSSGESNTSTGTEGHVPYQCRHSGASLHEAGQHRTTLEIKKRGRWKSDNSIARYGSKKSGRLAQIQSDLTRSQLSYFEATDLALWALIFWKLRVEDVLRPSLMVAASS